MHSILDSATWDRLNSDSITIQPCLALPGRNRPERLHHRA